MSADRGLSCWVAAPPRRLLGVVASAFGQRSRAAASSAALVALSLLMTAGQAGAQTLSGSGRITGVFMASPGNMPFRISLDTSVQYAHGILFAPFDQPNYQAYVSGLLMAYAQGKTVTVYYTPNYAVAGQTLNACTILEYGVS
ncbi:MAG TPA: hypothetical protein VNZ85_02410 [Caulobacter sp.]|nr:hypothetical protein [Caulobacter sp.]